MELLPALIAILGQAASPAAADRHAAIFRTVRDFERAESKALAEEYLTGNATLEFPDLPRSDSSRKRLWSDVPTGGVRCDTRVVRMSIVASYRDKATVDAKTACKVRYLSMKGFSASGVTTWMTDRLQLQRVGDRWLIASVLRRTRETGSDAAWHRRNP